MGLGVALMSYDGKVCWGFNADYEMLPDLPAFVTLVEQSFAQIQEAVRVREVKPLEPPARIADPDREHAAAGRGGDG